MELDMGGPLLAIRGTIGWLSLMLDPLGPGPNGRATQRPTMDLMGR